MSPVSRECNVPIVLHLHAHYLLRDLLGLRVFSNPCVVSASPTVTTDLENFVGAQPSYLTITNAINGELFDEISPIDLKKELGLDDEKPLFICVGALVPAKGPMVLLEAIRELKHRGVRVNLAFAGEGMYRHELETFCSENNLTDQVHFLGQRNDIANLLSGNIDGFITPTLFECYPLVLGERGLLASQPSRRIQGDSHIIGHEKTGLLVEPNDSNSLASAIERLVLNPKFREQLGVQFNADAKDRFDMNLFIDQFIGLYEQALEKPGEFTPSLKRSAWATKIAVASLLKRMPLLKKIATAPT